MLSIKELRQRLPSNCLLTDADLELLRDEGYVFANIVVDEFLIQERAKRKSDENGNLL